MGVTWRHGFLCVAGAALVVAVAVAVGDSASGTSSGDTGYTRIAREVISTGEGPVLSGDRVLVGSTRRGRAVVRVLGLDGSRRGVLRIPGAERTVMELAASNEAVAMTTGTLVLLSAGGAPATGPAAAFGPPAGPLRAFAADPTDVAVAGPYVLAYENDGRRDVVRVHDVRAPGAPAREIAVPGTTLFLDAAGRYFAMLAGNGRGRSHVVVFDVLTGAEVYRVRAGFLQDEAIAPDGRIVMAELAGRGTREQPHVLVTAAPAEPERRVIARMPLDPPRLAATESGVAVIRRTAEGLGQIVVVGYDGSRRPVTPVLNDFTTLDYDGSLLAFSAGRCVFAGAVTAGPPPATPRDPCFVEAATLDFARLDRFAQSGGRRVRVPLTCDAPAGNHCTARVRLTGPGFTVRRRARIAPGAHVLQLRITAGRRRAAWRSGMLLRTFERGGGGSGARLPRFDVP
jgi:hypothetical protein